MPSLKQISGKISSVKGTRRIMSAMKLIAAVKLQRAQSLLKLHRAYFDAYAKITARTIRACEPEAHPLLFSPEERKNIHIIFLTSDRGLCGNFNSVLIKALDSEINSLLSSRALKKEDLKITFIGSRGRSFFAPLGFSQGPYYMGVREDNFPEISAEIASAVTSEFSERQTDEVILAHSVFVSALSRKTVFETVLPLEFLHPDSPEDRVQQEIAEPIFEPSKQQLLERLIPRYLRLRMEKAVLESLTSEHSARMTAMESAAANADEMIKNLTLLFNKTRQAIITTELMDIVNGTEALKGGDD